jgi:dTDP-4-amino-4,6-dideoxygalactose transaminase
MTSSDYRPRSTFLPFAKPAIGEEEIAEVVDTLRTGWLATGPKVQRLEAEFAERVGARHAVAVMSGTAALHLAVDTLGLKPGDRVLIPSMTFTATAEVVCYLGAVPTLVDVDDDTLNISPEATRAVLEALPREERARVRAIMPVHFGGHACPMDEIRALAEEFRLTVVEDAAHAFPASYHGRAIGAISELTAFSFYTTKTITTGEGGMVTTTDDERARRMRVMRFHGISRDAWDRYSEKGTWYYEVVAPGFKYGMPDLCAAIGLGQLRRADELLRRRAEIAAAYDRAFASVPELQFPVIREGVAHAWHLYPIRLRLEALTLTRGEFIERLKALNIGTSVHYIPLHHHPFYRESFGCHAEQFPVAQRAYERLVSLPIYPTMTDDDVEDVIGAVRHVLASARG